jgi:hypothetical protein
MKKTLSSLLLLALLCAAGASSAAVHLQCSQKQGKCLPPPVPPTPPSPPAPPTPPAPLEVPEGAHAACASKGPGSTVTWVISKGETMTGVCERQAGKMVFQLRSYEVDD